MTDNNNFEQMELFTNFDDTAPSSINPMILAFGTGPPETTCETCKCLYSKKYEPNIYFKCSRRKDTNSSASDHKKHWRSCVRYEPKLNK